MEDQVITEAVEQVEQPAKLTTYSGLQNDLATFETKESEAQQVTDTSTEVQVENTTTEAPQAKKMPRWKDILPKEAKKE